MDTTVPLNLPANLYAELQRLAEQEQSDPVTVIARLVHDQSNAVSPEMDPVFALVGAYASTRPLIDGIPLSADPDLYLVAECLGPRASGMHAWDIAPARYAPSSEWTACLDDGHDCALLHNETVKVR